MSIVKSITVTGPNDISVITVGTQGAAGAQGPAGAKGEKGAVGQSNVAGPTGAK